MTAIEITIRKAEARIDEIDEQWRWMSADQRIDACDEIDELNALIARCRRELEPVA